MIELYGFGPTRWAKPYWMMKELGKEFKEQAVDLSKGEHKSPKFLAMNPFGKVPVMKDGTTVLFESTAILNYLGEKYPESALVPKSGTPERGQYDQWMSYCITELEQPLWRITKHTHLLPAAVRIPAEVKLAKTEFDETMKILDGQIGAKKYLVGNKFTAVDITLGYTLGWANGMGMVESHKNCARYLKDMMARPTFPGQLFAR